MSEGLLTGTWLPEQWLQLPLKMMPPLPTPTGYGGIHGYADLMWRALAFYSYLLAHASFQNPSMASIPPTVSLNPPHPDCMP